MSNKPILVVMAAGMGSRYGGLKQIEPVGPNGEIIIEYSLFDARNAGFETVVFIIKEEIEAEFRKSVGDKAAKIMNVKYAFQKTDDIPEGFFVPDDRVKPWGTAHAVLSARDLVDAPFAVINADDYYGKDSFKVIYDYLKDSTSTVPYNFCMVAYTLENTLTENGFVSRGVCITDENDILLSVTEVLRIEKSIDGARYTEDDSESYLPIDSMVPVSMNLWGFTKEYMQEAWNLFPKFLEKNLPENPLKCEFFLPSVVSELISMKKAEVKVLHCKDKWYGVTYKEDKPKVQAALKALHGHGIYPQKLE